MEFRIKLAGKVLGVSSVYPSTRDFCRGYITEEPAAFQIALSPEEIEKERSFFRGGSPPRPFSAPYLERLALYRKIAECLLSEDIMLFHGSALALDGAGYLFTAPSGTGKSTHVALWRAVFGDRVQMVNDDKPLLKITEDGIWVCGTPWDGKHRLSSNISVPLRGVCLLTRDTVNHIEPVSGREALPVLLEQSQRPAGAEKMACYLKLLDRFSKGTRFYRLGCNMEPEAARVAYAGMARERREDEAK